MMPAGVAPTGSLTGELGSSVRLPPETAKMPTEPILLSSTYRQRPLGLSRASTAPTPPLVVATGVLPSRISVPPSVPASFVPVPLNSTSPGAALAARVTVDRGIGNRWPPKSRKPV